jgi:hypothetical protein
VSGVVWPSVIAVAGTLAGAGLAAVVQARAGRVQRRETRRDSRRSEVLVAVSGLVSALAEHRLAMWVVGELRLSGAVGEVVAQARAAAHVTRSAVTAPLVTVRVVAPVLAVLADRAVQAVYGMRHPTGLVELEARRQDALEASDRLVEAAAEFFTDAPPRRWSV